MRPHGRFGQALGQTFSSFKYRNFRLYFSGQIVSNTGNWLTNIALTLLVLKITGSGFDVGLLAAFQYGPILFLSAWGGAIADRVDKRRFLMLTQCLEMAQSAGLAILAFLPHPPLVGLFALAAAGGIFLAFDNPLRRSFVSEMVPRENIPNAVVLYSTLVNLSRIFGPALAGLLVITAGYGWAFALDSASYLVVLACLFRMRPAELYRQPARAKTKGDIRAGLRYVKSMPLLWISFVMLAAIGALSYNFNVTLPIFVSDSLHRSNATYTILYSVFSAGAVVVSLIVAHRKLVQMRHIVYGAAAVGVTMLLLGATSSVSMAIPVIFLVGMSSILYSTATTTMVQVESRPDMIGRVLALQTVLLIGPKAIGGPILGWLADNFGGRSPIILGGVVCLLAAGFGYYASIRYIQKPPAKGEPRVSEIIDMPG